VIFLASFACGMRFTHRETEVVYPARGEKAPTIIPGTSVKTHQMQLTKGDRAVASAVARFNRSIKS
jgi:hypothetical protein